MSDQAMKDIRKDIYLMLKKAEQMLEFSEDGFAKNKVSALDQADEISREIIAKEDRLTEQLSKLAPSSQEARGIISVPAHIEKIATNLARLNDGIRVKIKDGLLFSDKAMKETAALFGKIREVLKKSGEAVVSSNAAAIAAVGIEADAAIRLAESSATTHEDRLVTGECSPKSSSVYLCILYSFEDIASHAKEAVRKSAAK